MRKNRPGWRHAHVGMTRVRVASPAAAGMLLAYLDEGPGTTRALEKLLVRLSSRRLPDFGRARKVRVRYRNNDEREWLRLFAARYRPIKPPVVEDDPTVDDEVDGDTAAALSEAERVRVLALPIKELKLTARPDTGLDRGGIRSIGALTNRTRADLLDIRNLGKKSIDEVRMKLWTLFGLTLKDDVPPDPGTGA